MFRLGGNTDQGIMSGVVPRQGYSDGYRARKVGELGSMTIGELEDMARQSTRGDRRADMRDFMVDWGLGMVGTPPTGNILSTAANVARAPYERFQQRKTGRAQSESDMFSTLFKGAAAAAGEAGGGKGWLEQWKFQQVPVLLNTIAEIEAIPEEERTPEQNQKLESARINLERLRGKDPFIDFFLQPDIGGKYFKKIKTELLEQDQQSDEPKYTGEDDPKLWEDAAKEFKRRVGEMRATGGRVGYQAAGPVMGDAVQADQAMPEELGDISYEELRARLPQEVGDEIVRLLANSAEALEDFATIQTEQDIANFNKKYGVNLVLPAEG